MKKVESYNGDEKEIIKHGDGLDPEGRIKYYEDVINDLYVVHGAFKRDLYMEESSLKKKLEKEIEKAKSEISNTEQIGTIVKIKGKYGLVDIARIFEAMKEAGIISTKTEVSQIAQVFFSDALDRNKFVTKYNATKSDFKNNMTNSNSAELLDFIKILISNSLDKKKSELLELEKHISNLQKNLI
jgi:hypothetical protein